LQDISLSEKLKISPQRGLGYLLLAKSLERMGDHALKISRIHDSDSTEKTELEVEIRKITERMVGNIEDAVGSFFFRDFDAANLVIERVRIIQREIQGLIQNNVMSNTCCKESNIDCAMLLDSLKCVCAYTIDIAENSINNQYVEDE
jgi:Na+/phosphate symporter